MLAAQDELGAPALAFVRTVCAVLALDSGLQQELAVLRRNLLKLVHVREFASASEFKASVLMAPCGLFLACFVLECFTTALLLRCSAALTYQGLCVILSFAFSGADGAVWMHVTRAPTNYKLHVFDGLCTPLNKFCDL